MGSEWEKFQLMEILGLLCLHFDAALVLVMEFIQVYPSHTVDGAAHQPEPSTTQLWLLARRRQEGSRGDLLRD